MARRSNSHRGGIASGGSAVAAVLLVIIAVLGVLLVVHAQSGKSAHVGEAPGYVEPTSALTTPPKLASTVECPVNGSAISVDGLEYHVQSPGKQYSMYLSPSYYRFDLHNGDSWPNDLGPRGNVTRNRAELSSQQLPYDTNLWMAWSIRIPSSTHLTPRETVVGQLHSLPDKRDFPGRHPVLVFRLVGTKGAYQIQTRSDPKAISTAVPAKITDYNGPPLSRNVWHHVVVSLRFSKTKPGHLVVWLDGKQIVDKPSIHIGYNDVKSPYWKFGDYHPAFNESNVIEWAHMQISHTSLTSQVAKPLTPGSLPTSFPSACPTSLLSTAPSGSTGSGTVSGTASTPASASPSPSSSAVADP